MSGASTPTRCPTRRGRPVSRLPYLAGHPDGVVVHCWVVPGSSRNELSGVHGEALKVRVAAPPEGGRANDALCRLLAEVTGYRAEVAKGTSSRSKTILLRGASLPEVEKALG